MFVFDENSTRRTLTPWGIAVKKRLIDKHMQQKELVSALQEKGFDVNTSVLSMLFYGIGAPVRMGEIEEINRILEIPYKK